MTTENSETKSIITGLLTSTPLRCTMKQLCDDFRNTVGYNIPFRKLGFLSAEEYLRSIPDTVHIIGSGPSAEVKGVVKEKSAHINQMVAKQKRDSIPLHKRKNIKNFSKENQQKGRSSSSTLLNGNSSTASTFKDEYKSRIPKRIQNNLRKLVLKFPNGIWCRRLPEEYCKMFREELNYEKFNYRSLIEMCTDLHEIFHYIQPSSDDFMLYDKSKAIPSLNQNEQSVKNSEKNIIDTSDLDWSLGSKLIPSDVVPFLDEIPRCPLNDIKVGDYLNINVGEIYDIDKFWIFPKYGALDTLLNELQSFFHTRRNQYIIPKLFLEEGLYCIVYYKNEYHRCIITDVLPRIPDFVEVLFIDYGSVGRIVATEIWYLPKQFARAPCQAIKARLSNVRSLVVQDKSVSKFRQLIENAELVAEVMKIDEKAPVVEIYLANITNENSIFYVNDALVDKGYAEYC